jgi:hypothetical protein
VKLIIKYVNGETRAIDDGDIAYVNFLTDPQHVIRVSEVEEVKSEEANAAG